jgi:D-sedoheptulose 7-phosphate isomerase
MNSFPATYLESLQRTLGGIPMDKVNEAIEWMRQVREEGRTIFACGNGGSASTASHFVCDVLKGASFNRPKRFRIMALTDSLPTLTAYSNDVSYDCVFVEQLKNFGQPGDLLLCLSGSGNSPNVLRAVEYANQAGLKTVGLTGRDGGQLGRLSQLEINVADPHMGRIEDGHMIVCHMLAYYFMDTEKADGTCQG